MDNACFLDALQGILMSIVVSESSCCAEAELQAVLVRVSALRAAGGFGASCTSGEAWTQMW